jgi:hypothetical protein
LIRCARSLAVAEVFNAPICKPSFKALRSVSLPMRPRPLIPIFYKNTAWAFVFGYPWIIQLVFLSSQLLIAFLTSSLTILSST